MYDIRSDGQDHVDARRPGGVSSPTVPGLYEVQAFPAADRIAHARRSGCSETLDGGNLTRGIVRPGETAYYRNSAPAASHADDRVRQPQDHKRSGANEAAGHRLAIRVERCGGLAAQFPASAVRVQRQPLEPYHPMSARTTAAATTSRVHAVLRVPRNSGTSRTLLPSRSAMRRANYSMTACPTAPTRSQSSSVESKSCSTAWSRNVTIHGGHEDQSHLHKWRKNLDTRNYLDGTATASPMRCRRQRSRARRAAPGEGGGGPILIRYRDGSIGSTKATDLNGSHLHKRWSPSGTGWSSNLPRRDQTDRRTLWSNGLRRPG